MAWFSQSLQPCWQMKQHNAPLGFPGEIHHARASRIHIADVCCAPAHNQLSPNVRGHDQAVQGLALLVVLVELRARCQHLSEITTQHWRAEMNGAYVELILLGRADRSALREALHDGHSFFELALRHGWQ